MKRDILNRSELSLKFTAVVVAAMIVISSAAMIEVMINASPENEAEPSFVDQSFQSRTCKATSIPAQEGDWITADSSLEGTPAEAHVTVSDTSGITIVVDFHGFWLNNCTIDSTSYYDLNMPGASSIQAYGKPVLPCLFEFVQIPYDVDIEVDVLSSTSANVSEYISDYEIKPGPFPEFPSPIGEGDEDVSSTIEPALFFDPVYSNGTLFPGITTSTEGELNSTSMIMRGHRLLGLSFYPVQYNNATSELILYSQLIVKVKYSFPAQINPIPKHLCSKPFERIIDQTVLNCRASEMELYIPGIGEVIQYIIPELFFKGAEYLIITNSTFEDQANRLADWKERKGLLSDVQVIPDYVVDVRNYVKNFLNFVYYHWYPAPTYVLLMGDVEAIPTNYDMDHNGMADGTRFFEPGSSKIASDFGYFNIEGNGYFPDMIYSRISVDTELQAEIIVNKTLLYEQSPPADTTFYENFLSAGYFQDKPPDPYTPRDGTEDVNYPMIYTLERIRHYLNHTLGYNAHINYSSAINDQIPLLFQKELNGDADVAVSIGRENYFPNFAWLEGYDWSGKWGRDYYYELERGNITPNFNEGRFLVLYFGHGGSKNMYNPINILSGYQPNPETEPGVFAVDYRDVVEGWQHPCLNTSFFADL
ncbi:MAG: hypothetical protein KAU48_04915, partial [Candidatus Thorarchaeota archaeon]|nr:hypothetical protein [Candidatus Thorarchaeota archaeon]